MPLMQWQSLRRCSQLWRSWRIRSQQQRLLLVVTCLQALPACAQATEYLAELSLEELAEIPVTSVSKAAKPLATAAASIYVLTQRDLARAAVTTVPEALRRAPNAQVARTGAGGFAITSRGFNNVLANKLLVMIDGRSVYSPLFSGVFWDAQDVVLEDLDRIEVISGPGGTLWGANAVNGVVNIVSRRAEHTQGTLLSAGAGGDEQQVVARYGGKMARNGYYRVYAKHHRHEQTHTAAGTARADGWHRSQAGFRTDWQNDADSLTVQGDIYRGELDQRGPEVKTIGGANILVRGSRVHSPRSNVKVQIYLDHTRREHPQSLAQQLNTFDIELQHEWSADQRHHFVWGGGYRYAADRIDHLGDFAFVPADKNMHWHNIFLQDEIKLFDRIRLTLGGKLEHNPFTGWEALPSAQLAWVTAPRQLLWSSLSRVVRSPSRIDRHFYSPANPEVLDGTPQYSFAGGPGFVSEVADVLQLGYRAEHWAKLSYSITGYYSHYDKLRTIEPLGETARIFANQAEADSYGLEMWATWQAATSWRLHGGLVVQRADIKLKPGSQDSSDSTSVALRDPQHYWQLRSSYDASENLTIDATLRHVDKLADAAIPAYTELDAIISWRVQPGLTLSLLGRNLFDRAHVEFGSGVDRSVHDRAIFGKLVWEL